MMDPKVKLPLLPLRYIVVFPNMVITLFVVRYKSNKISKSDIKKFNRFIPNRFKLFDEMNFNMYPL